MADVVVYCGSVAVSPVLLWTRKWFLRALSDYLVIMMLGPKAFRVAGLVSGCIGSGVWSLFKEPIEWAFLNIHGSS